MNNDLVEAADAQLSEGQDHCASTPANDLDKSELCRQGMAAFIQGDYRAAIDRLNEGLSEDRSNWKAMCCLGLSYCHSLQLRLARETFSHVADNCPDEDIKSRCVGARERLEDALSRGVVGVEPETVELSALNKEGWTVEQQEEAGPELTEEERTKYRKWGTNSYLNAKYEKAIEYLEVGLGGGTQDDNARFCLGMSYFKVARYDSARDVFNKIVAECQDGKIVGRARQALQSVTSAELEPPPSASDSAAPAGAAAPAAPKRKAHAESHPQVILHEGADEEELEAAPARRTHPVAVVVLVCGLLVGAYYGAMMLLPNIYTALLVPSAISMTSVQKFGELDGVEGTTVEIPAANQTKLYGVYYTKPHASRVVIINPGVTDDSAFRKKLAAALLHEGLAVLLYDGHGTGGSSGRVTWQSIVNDGSFAYDFLIGKISPDADICTYGNSWGAAAAVQTAYAHPHCAVAVENPFFSIPHLARAKCALLDIFPDSVCPEPIINLAAMLSAPKHSHAPLLVLIGQDTMVPAAESQAFFQQASDPKKLDSSSGSSDSARIAAIVKFFSGL